jgi:hypothetical protein
MGRVGGIVAVVPSLVSVDVGDASAVARDREIRVPGVRFKPIAGLSILFGVS